MAISGRLRMQNIQYVERWFDDHGYECIRMREYGDKTRFRISKDGSSSFFDLPNSVTDVRGYMTLFEKGEDLRDALKRL